MNFPRCIIIQCDVCKIHEMCAWIIIQCELCKIHEMYYHGFRGLRKIIIHRFEFRWIIIHADAQRGCKIFSLDFMDYMDFMDYNP